MWFISILAACVLGATAQKVSIAAPPFTLVDETLSVAYGDVSVSPPGRVLPLNVPLGAPRVGVPARVVGKGPFLLIVIDPDSSRPYVLHWLQPNLSRGITADSTNIASLTPLNNTPALTSYREPRPPAGSGPHRYTFLLFNQPANFSIPSDFVAYTGPEAQRASFDFSRFVAETRLGKPVAANYFLSENSTAVNSTATGSSNATSRGTGTIPRATVTPYTGGAGTSHIAISLAILSGLGGVMIASLS